jgi:uncharacterized protein (TIGR00162 family)
MVCRLLMTEEPKLNNPILIEGLPGIGFVANIVALHLIRELKAEPFAEIRCSSFQDLAVTAEGGKTREPTNRLYYYSANGGDRDLIILYGNTQALTSTGQYELCSRILTVSEKLGCRLVVTLGGLKRETEVKEPKLFFAATDRKIGKQMLQRGVQIIDGRIFGVAGLLVGLARLRELDGFCLLAETPGVFPDRLGAGRTLDLLIEMFDLKINTERLENTVEETRRLLESFGLLQRVSEERKKAPQLRWLI